MLNDYTVRNGGGTRFPAAYIPAFCEATGDDRLRRFLLDRRLQAVIDLGKCTLDAVRENEQTISTILESERKTGKRVKL